MEMVGEAVFVPVFLDLQVAFRVFDLFGNGDQLMAFADADAEQLRHSEYHIDGIGVAALFAHEG